MNGSAKFSVIISDVCVYLTSRWWIDVMRCQLWHQATAHSSSLIMFVYLFTYFYYDLVTKKKKAQPQLMFEVFTLIAVTKSWTETK